MKEEKTFAGWRWVPTLYFAEGVPFMVVSVVSAILFKSIGMDNTRMAFWTGLMMLPWSIKPLWAPLLDEYGSKRQWIFLTQAAMALFFALSAFFLGFSALTAVLIVLFFLLALASATHDAAADGFYLLALNSHEQSFFAGIRSTFYRIATVSVQGGLVALAGIRESRSGSIRQGWALSLGVAAVVMTLLVLWHFRQLPRVEKRERETQKNGSFLNRFTEGWLSFLRLPGAGRLILFLFLFRVAESQLGKIAGVFLIDSPAAGGLGLSLAFQGFLYGTLGVIALTVGGILGGIGAAKYGFRRCAWFFTAALNVPDILYVYLALCRPASPWIVGSCVAVEQFGYGLGYTALMMVMLAAASHSGKYRTTHFALMTAISILAMTLFSMVSGWVQQRLGYSGFFCYVVVLTIPSFFALGKVLKGIPEDFGISR